MGKSSQRKGRNGELELCRILREYGIPAQPGQALNFGTVPDITGVKDIHPECKRVEKLNVGEAMNQAVRDAGVFEDGAPTLFHRRNRQPWLVTMRLTDWIKFYQAYERRA